MEGKLTQCLAPDAKGTYKIMIDGVEYYTKQDCNGLLGQDITCSHWLSEWKGKKNRWCKDVKASGGKSEAQTESKAEPIIGNKDEQLRLAVLGFSKDLAVAGKIEVANVTIIAEDFFGYVKAWDKKSESEPF